LFGMAEGGVTLENQHVGLVLFLICVLPMEKAQ
jgi:hypothetical protein